MMEAWVYNFAESVKAMLHEIVDIQEERLKEEKKQTELLKQIADNLQVK